MDTVDPTTTTTPGDSTTSSSAPPLAVSAILQAANPFDATHGFTVLARHAGELRAGTTLGAVAIGGDLRFGPYTVTPAPPARLDETPIGLLVGGSVGLGSSAGRLTVGGDAHLLIGKIGAVQTAAVDGGVAVLPAGADVAADPQLRVDGPQEPQTVSSPGTFERAFGGVFADLAARARTLAKLKPTMTPTAADGAAIASAGLPRADVHLAAGEGDGPSVWSVHAADLAQIGSIAIDPAPTEQRPLVINVDGDGGKVLLDRAVTVDAAARADIVWNVVDTKAVVVGQPLAGSLLAPTAPVQIDADVSGQVVADAVVQHDGTVGGTPFAGRAAEGGRHDDDHGAAHLVDAARHQRRRTGRRSGPRDRAAGDRQQRRHHREGRRRPSVGQRGRRRWPGSRCGSSTASTAPTTPVADTFATCVSDADGDCSFTVPNTQARRRQPGPAVLGRADGHADRLVHRNAVARPAPTPRRVDRLPVPHRRPAAERHHLHLVRHQRHFMLGTGNTNNVASGGIWQTSRNNPSLPRQVRPERRAHPRPVRLGRPARWPPEDRGQDVHELARRDTLAGRALHLRHHGPGRHHATTRTVPSPPCRPQAGADTVNGWIDGPRPPAAGRTGIAASTRWPRAGPAFDVAIVITDGNPTFYGNRPRARATSPGCREVENGIFSANAVKAEATRMIAVGVGAGVSGSPNNLVAISGPTANSDYYQTTDYTAAGAALRALALGTCQGSVSVVKQVVPSTAPPGRSPVRCRPAGGSSGPRRRTSGVAIDPTSGTTAAARGALNFNLTFPGGTTTAPVTVTETQQAGYTLVPQIAARTRPVAGWTRTPRSPSRTPAPPASW